MNRELLDYLASLVDKRLEAPGDDVISKLCREQVKPGNIEKADAVQIAFLLLVAGNATMVNMIALVSLDLGHLVSVQPVTTIRELLPCSNTQNNWRSSRKTRYWLLSSSKNCVDITPRQLSLSSEPPRLTLKLGAR